MAGRVRAAALALLPAALQVSASHLPAAALAVLFVALSTERRALRLTLPVVGFLVAGGLSVLVNPSAAGLTAWAFWLLGVVALVAVYVSSRPGDARPLALGAAAANLAAAALALLQVADEGSQARLLSFHPNLAAAWCLASLGANLAGWRAMRERPLLLRGSVAVGVPAGFVALALTGSRSGILGATAGLVVLLFVALLRLRGRAVALGVLTLLVLGVGSWQVDAYMRGPVTPNLLTNSGFEHGTLPWVAGSGSQRVVLPGGGGSVRLERDEPGTLLRYAGGVPVGGESDLELSLSVRPEGQEGAGPGLAVSVAVDALDADGAVLSRLGVEGWTESASASLTTVGNRPALPTEPVGEWQRYTLPIPALPTGTARLTVELQIRGGGGAYGLVDDIMLAPAGTGDYVAGGRPGLFTPLAPSLARLSVLRRPFEASGGRVAMWFLGLDLAAARPVLGYGLGSGHALADEHGWRVRTPLEHFHSLYVQLLVEGGAVLFAAFLVMVGAFLAHVARSVARGRQGASPVLAVAVALLVQSVFDPVLSFVPVLCCYWLAFCASEA